MLISTRRTHHALFPQACLDMHESEWFSNAKWRTLLSVSWMCTRASVSVRLNARRLQQEVLCLSAVSACSATSRGSRPCQPSNGISCKHRAKHLPAALVASIPKHSALHGLVRHATQVGLGRLSSGRNSALALKTPRCPPQLVTRPSHDHGARHDVCMLARLMLSKGSGLARGHKHVQWEGVLIATKREQATH